jgi:acyl dehydratase
MFARAVGDDNPVYSDAAYASETEVGGIVAPPTFMQASAQFDPDYFLRPKPGKTWFGSGKEATGVRPDDGASKTSDGGDNKAILHAEQHFVYHRHPTAGDVLTAETRAGKRWEKEGRRSGKLIFTETITEYRNQDGELMVTATGVGVVTERPVDQ